MGDFEKILGSIIILLTLNHYLSPQSPPQLVKKVEIVKQVKSDLDSVEKTLEKEMKTQINDFVNKELEEVEKGKEMPENLMNVLASDLNNLVYDPYESNLFPCNTEPNQIKYNDLPKFVNMTKNRYIPKTKQKEKPKESKSYLIDNQIYYNPCSDDKFGFVSANDTGCVYSSF